MKKITILTLTACIVLGFGACDNDEDDNGEPDNNNELEVPNTYKWEDANYPGQTARIKLLDKLSSEIAKANQGNTVNEQDLIDIYENNGEINANKNLAGKTYPNDKQKFYDWFEEIDSLTNNPNTGDTIIDGRFFTESGIEILQMVEKGLMGASFYWQGTSEYLQDLASDPNQDPQNGNKPTTREHHFDEAFGYMGLPKNFLSNSNDEVAGDYVNSTWFWGHYLRSRNPELSNKKKLFNAFLKGRAAITQQKPDKREEAVSNIKEEWELLVAANVAHYINATISDINKGNTGDKWHHWSEAKAFHMSLKYNVDKTISNNDWNYIGNKLGDSPKNVSKSDLEDANSRLDQAYDFPTNITNF